MKTFRTIATLFLLSSSVVIGCAATPSEAEDQQEDDGTGTGAGAGAGSAESAATVGESYMLVPSIDPWENDALFEGLRGIGRLIPRTAEVGQSVGDSKIGLSCRWDHNAGSQLCSLYVPWKPSAPLMLDAGARNPEHSIELHGDITFAGPVAKKIFDKMRDDNDQVRKAGPLTCTKLATSAAGAKCVMTPKTANKRRVSVQAMPDLVASGRITQAQATAIAALAQ